jgi:hypothetical protein
MTRLPGVIASEAQSSEYTSRYEMLRSQAIDGQAQVARFGLAVLLRQGMAVWMDAWSKLPEPPSSRSARDQRPRSLPLPAESSAAVVHVLAAMAFSHMQEVRA